MAHRLLMPPVRRMEGRARLPMIQHVGEAIANQLQTSLRPRDALRQGGTSRSGISTGPLSSPQQFTVEQAGGTNSPEAMRPGLRVRNAPRAADKTRGQSAGI